jgi:mutator protein MutT
MSGTESIIPVVAAVIERDGRFLVCKRPAHKRHGGLWEFPGGKVHEGETLEQAVARELEEELEMAAMTVAREPRFRARDPGSSFEILFLDTSAGGTPRPLEHEALGWFTPAELKDLPLAPSDRRFADEGLAGPG